LYYFFKPVICTVKKKIIELILSLFITSFLYCQVPNGGFEKWTNGQPDNWTTSNSQSLYTNITRTGNAHSGSFALKGEVIKTSIAGLSIINPFIRSGNNGNGFHVEQIYDSISGYYQFHADSGDKFIANITMMKEGQPIGNGVDSLAPVSSYKMFNFKIAYDTAEVPDTCIIIFIITGPMGGVNYHVGSYFILDDLSLSGIETSVVTKSEVVPKNYMLYQNYPNPFNPNTTIKFSLPNSGIVKLILFDIMGRKIATLFKGYKSAGIHEVNFNADFLPSGIYLYKLQADKFSEVKKLVLLK